jgi:hypothetical protein
MSRDVGKDSTKGMLALGRMIQVMMQSGYELLTAI